MEADLTGSATPNWANTQFGKVPMAWGATFTGANLHGYVRWSYLGRSKALKLSRWVWV